MMVLDELKDHVRQAAAEVVVEVFREEFIAVRERLNDVNAHIIAEVDFLKQSGQELVEVAGLKPHLTAMGEQLGAVGEQLRPHVERVETSVRPHLERVESGVRPHLDRIGSGVCLYAACL